MTVQTAETKTHYAGNGLTTEWPIPFPVVQEEHIKLIKTSPDGEDEEITTGYTVNGMESGAVSITYPTTGEPLGAGWQLTIYRDMPLTQTLDLESGGAFDAEVIERQGFDHVVMQIQQLQEQTSRALLVAITDVDRNPNEVINEIFVARGQATAAAGNAEQSASDSSTAAQETQDLLDSVGVGTATHSGFTPLAPEGWEAGHGLILNEDGTTSYGPLLVDVPLASAPSEEHPDGVAGIVTPDGETIKVNGELITVPGCFYPGDIELKSFRATELPFGWYFCNGDQYLLNSPQGQALNALSAQYKTDWGITVAGEYISIPNLFYSNGRGLFLRAADGTSRAIGLCGVQTDAIRNITGQTLRGDGNLGFLSTTNSTTTVWNGALGTTGSATTFLGGGLSALYYGKVSIDTSKLVPTASENRPLNVGMTPAIYLGV